MPTQPKVDAVWARLVCGWLSGHGGDPEQALGEAGLTRADIEPRDSRIPIAAHDRLFEIAARLLDDDHFGLHFGTTIDPRDVGLLAYIGLSSRSLRDAMENHARYIGVFSDSTRITIDRDRAPVRFRIIKDDPPDRTLFQDDEASLAFALNAYRRYAERELIPVEVHFRHDRGQAGRQEFERLFKCPVRFGCPDLALVLNPQDLDIPMTTADDRLLEILRGYCDEILKEQRFSIDAFQHEVAEQIIALLPRGKAKAKVVAAEMGMSERTFSRRLAEADTTFTDLRDRMRHDLSLRYLRDTDLSLTKISLLLGYSESSAFNHAFRRWAGQSPRNLRSIAVNG